MKTVDTRGMSCPQPVLMVKQVIGSNLNELEVLVDNQAALNNVTRFLKSAGFMKIETTLVGEETQITAKK